MTSSNLHGTSVRVAKETQYNTALRQPLYQSTKPCRYSIQHQQHHQQQQQQQHQQHQQQQQYNEYLHHQQNMYDYKMKMRPLPTVPAHRQQGVSNEQQAFQVSPEQMMMMEDYNGDMSDQELNQEEFRYIV